MNKDELMQKPIAELRELSQANNLDVSSTSKEPYADALVKYFNENPLPTAEASEVPTVEAPKAEAPKEVKKEAPKEVKQIEGGIKGRTYNDADLGTDVHWYKKVEVVPSPFDPKNPYKRTLKIVSLHMDDAEVLNNVDDPANKRVIYERLNK